MFVTQMTDAQLEQAHALFPPGPRANAVELQIQQRKALRETAAPAPGAFAPAARPPVVPEIPRNDYVLTDDDRLGEGSLSEKFQDNIKAIEILRTLRAEGRHAVGSELRQLARYVGWGGLKGVFDPDNKTWTSQHQALKALLTDAEWAAASRSQLDAFYTPPPITKAIFKALERLGFSGGRVIDPAVGVGNFFGSMPAGMRSGSQLHGVELDILTSQIVQALYPNTKISQATGFQAYSKPSGYFDVAIGNPPFGSQTITDDSGSAYSGWSIHNYFFAKSIDLLRPDGLMTMVVSHNFLDKLDPHVRQWISRRAELVSAVRLPQTAFKASANTEVVTDVLVFKRLDYRNTLGRQEMPDWLQTAETLIEDPKTGEAIPVTVNKYFLNNPQNVLGEHATESSAYRANEYTVKPNGDLAEQLDRWVDTLPQGIYVPLERPSAELERQAVELPEFAKEGSFFLQGKEVWQRLPDLNGEHRAEQWTPPNERALERMTGMIRLRDALRRQMKLERTDAPLQEIEAGRAYLNRLYDGFQAKYGFVNDPTNRRLFLDDTESALLQALEFDYERAVTESYAEEHGVEARPAKATKADIFKRRVLFPPGEIEVVHTAKDALLHSLNYRGKVDMAYMQRAYGRGEREIIEELGDVLFVDPVQGLVTADEYLAGDVKTKLAEAIKAAGEDPTLQRNVAALERVIPADKLPSEIHASIGAAWIPAKHFEAFASLISGSTVSYTYLRATGQWLASGRSAVNYARNHSEYGTADLGALDLFLATMNGRAIQVRKPVLRDGKETYVVDEEKTEAARASADKIRALWDSWVWADGERAQELSSIYNDKYNRTVERHYDGSHLTFPGMSPHIELLGHQKNAVWRGLQDRNLLLDQVVGAGKTFEVVAIFMEMRRLGIAKKPMLAVPNHLTLQWRSEFHRLYPGANILAATPADFEKDNRERFFSKIVTGNWDAVIVGHSSLKKIPLPPEAEQQVLTEQVEDISSAIEELKRERGDRHIVRDMEKIKTNLEGKIKRLSERSGQRDKVVDMADLGVDAYGIDEKHEFKNLLYTTQMTNVAGLGNPAGSAKAFDLFAKIRWLKNTFGEDAPLITATGTPVSNSLAEMFTMQRYMQYERMRRMGTHVFDAWAKLYGDVQSVYEVAPSGTGYRLSQRFAKFKNLSSLMAEYRSFADVITLSHLKEQEIARGRVFPVPKLATGRPINVVVARSEIQEKFFGVPEIARNEQGEIVFEIDLRYPTQIVKGEDGRYKMQQDADGVVRHGARGFDTEEEAKHMTALSAVTPVMKIDPKSIIGMFERLRELTRTTNGRVNALSLTGLANKAGLDYRLIDPTVPDDPNSKVNDAVRRMLALGKKWEADRGVQLIFCDLSVPLSARAKMASKDKRLYVREASGELAHKMGTLHTKEGLETFPYYLVREGKGKSKTYSIYDAITGHLMKEGLDSKQAAHEFYTEFMAQDGGGQRWLDIRELSRPIGDDEIDEYRNEHTLDKDGDAADVEISRADVEGVTSATHFSIYDDMKAKLIAGGVPAHEIEFIHDHDSPQAKHQLFKRTNAGEVRYLFGSTPKMGAGTNVQERIVGLHNIDAPYRPSDLEQREGRAIRRGNKLYERDPEGFELEVYRYATAQTYDTRRWQLLEHKATGIEQLRNYSGINEMEDVITEASNSADMKAAASGNPLILKETQLANEVKRLRLLEKSHHDAQYTLQSRIRSNLRYANESGPKARAVLTGILEKRNSAKALGNYNGKVLHDKDAVMTAIDDISAHLNATTQARSIVYRGLHFTFSPEHDRRHYNMVMPDGDTRLLDTVSRTGVATRMENYCETLEREIANIDRHVAKAQQEASELAEKVNKPFEQVGELQKAISEHGRVQRALRKSTSLAAVKPHEMDAFKAAVAQQKQLLRQHGFADQVDAIEREETVAAEVAAPLASKPQCVLSGEFTGKVVSVDDEVVVQKTGRGDQLVHHDADRLGGTPRVGDVVTIRYVDGNARIIQVGASMELA